MCSIAAGRNHVEPPTCAGAASAASRSPQRPVPAGNQPWVTLAGSSWKWLVGGLLLAGPIAPGRAQLLEDPPHVMAPEEAWTEQQRDHAEAVAQYTHGRVLLQRGSPLEDDARNRLFAEALRNMQRAWWLDRGLVSIMDDIFRLSFTLNHSGEATRYALIAAEQQEVPLELLKHAAMVLAEQNEFDRALNLYRKIASRSAGPPDAVTQFEIGRLSLLVGKFEESAAAFAAIRDALEKKADGTLTDDDRARLLRNPEITYALMGESFLRANRLDEAEAMFRRAEEAKPNAAMLGLRLALIEKARGNRAQALRQLDEYFAAKTMSAGLLPCQVLEELLADANAAINNNSPPETAAPPPSPQLLDRLRELAANDPHNMFLGYFLADRLRAATLWDEAATRYRAMLAVESTADGHQGLVEIFLHQKQLVPLLEQLGEVVGQTGSLAPLDTSIDPLVKDPDLLEQLAGVARAQVADADHPPSPGVLMAMALLEAKARNVERAEQFWNEALKKPGPSAGQFAVNFGLLLLDQDEAARTARAFQRVLDEKLLPDRGAELHFYISGAWSLAKEFDKALAAAREAAKLEPNSARIVAREPWVLYQAKRLDEAEQAYRAILDRFAADYASEDNRAALRDIRFVLSAINVEQNRLADAEEWLQQVLDEFPDDIGALNDLGYLWCDQGKHLQRSLEMLQKAVQAEPDNVAYRDSLGWALYRVGRYTEALVELQKAAGADKVDGVILDHVGDAYLKVDQLPRAIEAWQKAAAAFERQDDTKRLGQVRDKIKQHAPQ
jgi:tetratricopeptide (TPR) repeat protein